MNTSRQAEHATHLSGYPGDDMQNASNTTILDNTGHEDCNATINEIAWNNFLMVVENATLKGEKESLEERVVLYCRTIQSLFAHLYFQDALLKDILDTNETFKAMLTEYRRIHDPFRVPPPLIPRIPLSLAMEMVPKLETTQTVPIIIIGELDIVGARVLEPRRNGFIYYVAPELQSMINYIALPSENMDDAQDGLIFNAIPSYIAHAVNIFVERHMSSGSRENMDENETNMLFLGTYYIQKTTDTLSKKDWDTLPEEIKESVINRICDADPASDRQHVRTLYDAGGIIPHAFLNFVGHDRTPVRASETPNSLASQGSVQEGLLAP